MKTSRFLLVSRLLLGILILSLVTFIFSLSFADADTSASDSSRVLDFLNGILRAFGTDFRLSHNFVRTLAHFLEFGLLGLLSLLFMFTFKLTSSIRVLWTLIFALSVASADETIQLFSDGRAFQLTDILVDMTGVITAILGLLLFMKLFKSLKMKKLKEIHNG